MTWHSLLFIYCKLRKCFEVKKAVFWDDLYSDHLLLRNFVVPLQDSPLAMTTLRTVHRNTAAQVSSQPSQGDKTQALYPASNSIVCISTTSSPPPYSLSPEGTQALHSFPVCTPTGPHGSQSDGMAFSRHLSQYSPRARSLTPDSTYTKSYKDSINEVGSHTRAQFYTEQHEPLMELCDLHPGVIESKSNKLVRQPIHLATWSQWGIIHIFIDLRVVVCVCSICSVCSVCSIFYYF